MDMALPAEWEPEVWAAAAAAASVARFCSCRGFTPGDGDTLELSTQSMEYIYMCLYIYLAIRTS